MRLYWNGEPVDFPKGQPASRLDDRVLVHSSQGVFSGVAVWSGDKLLVSFKGRCYTFHRSAPRKDEAAESKGDFYAPMTGLVVQVCVTNGQSVIAGEKLVVFEAMKTQQVFLAEFDGVVTQLPYSKGDQVQEGALLVKLERVDSKLDTSPVQ